MSLLAVSGITLLCEVTTVNTSSSPDPGGQSIEQHLHCNFAEHRDCMARNASLYSGEQAPAL